MKQYPNNQNSSQFDLQPVLDRQFQEDISQADRQYQEDISQADRQYMEAFWYNPFVEKPEDHNEGFFIFNPEPLDYFYIRGRTLRKMKGPSRYDLKQRRVRERRKIAAQLGDCPSRPDRGLGDKSQGDI